MTITVTYDTDGQTCKVVVKDAEGAILPCEQDSESPEYLTGIRAAKLMLGGDGGPAPIDATADGAIRVRPPGSAWQV